MISRFVKSFSHGQITIPKEFRTKLQLGEGFWLKLSLKKDKIVAEPALKQKKSLNYSKNLLKIKGSWFNLKDWQKSRTQVTTRLNQTK